MQATADSLSMCNNHTPLEVSEAKHLQWIDSILGIKGTTLIDYRNGYTNIMIRGFIGIELLIIFWYIPLALHMGKESDLGDGNHFVNKDSTIYLNVCAMYFDVLKDDYSLREWFDMMIDSEIEQGNRIIKKDITDHSYAIEGTTKGDKYFYSKTIYKKAYERDIIVIVKLEYIDSRRKEVETLLPNILKYISINNKNNVVAN